MQRRILLAVALVLVAALALAAWWIWRRPSAPDRAVVEARAVIATESEPVVLAPAEDRASDFVPSATRQTLAAVPPRASAANRAGGVGSIVGSVRSSDGQPLVFKRGQATLIDQQDRGGQPKPGLVEFLGTPETVRIDRSGGFEFHQLQPGQYEVVVDSDGFERTQAAVVVAGGSLPTRVEIKVAPIHTVQLSLVLRHESGGVLFDSVAGLELETAGMLRPVFVEECPAVGATLPTLAKKLVVRARDVRAEGTDQWMIATFNAPTKGCACVLLGDRVLDAVPFGIGQESVVLRVRSEDLRGSRCALDVIVKDAASGAALRGATVTVTQFDGKRHVAPTDEAGRSRFEDVQAGEVRLEISASEHEPREQLIALAFGERGRVETVSLASTVSVRGRVRFPPSGRVMHTVDAARVDGKAMGSNAVGRSTYHDNDEFEILGLLPGEYIVGVSSLAWPRPSVESVRRGEVRGWTFVDLRWGRRDGLELEIDETLAAKLREGITVR